MTGSDVLNTRTEGELGAHQVELRSLFETSKILNSSLELSTILNNLLLTPMGRMMISRGMVMIANEDKTFRIEVLKGLDPALQGKSFPIENTFTKPLLLSHTSINECKLKDFFTLHQIELLLPIISSNRLQGIIAFGKKITRLEFEKNELDFLDSLANIASTAIENAKIFQKLLSVNNRLDKKIQELNTLFEIGKELNSTLDVSKITNLLIYAIMGEMFATRCYVYLGDGDGLSLAEYRGPRGTDQDIADITTPEFLESISQVKVPLILEPTHPDPQLHQLISHQIKVIVPMRIQDVTKGILLLGEKINKAEYDNDDLDFLSTLCNQAMISLENARLFDEALEKERMEEELNIAREIQQRLFPESYPRFDCLEIKGLNIPSRQVGGDYYDCISLDDNRIAIAIGDVSGKGVGASLLMSNLHAGLHSLTMTKTDITSLVTRLNNLIHAHTSFDKFITFFYAELDMAKKQLVYCNAGHNPPYLIRQDGTVLELDVGGLLLGMMPNAPYETAAIDLLPGDMLLMFTDGVSEAMNPEMEEFEEWRILHALKEMKERKASVNDTLDHILQLVKGFTQGQPQSDDITMIGMLLSGCEDE